MTIKPELLVKSSDEILILPNSQNPKLLIPNKNIVQRWNDSKFFPAFRVLAKIYRFYLRIRTSIGLADTVVSRKESKELENFINDNFSDLEKISSQVLIGTEGPAQKYTVQFKMEGEIIGYLKYGELPSSMDRLGNEYFILQNLPPNVGPEPLKFDKILNGFGLLSKPVNGTALPANLSSLRYVDNFFKKVKSEQEFDVYSHPWIKELIDSHAEIVGPWVEKLTNRSWPMVIQHGDFAPWNIFYEKSENEIRAIDWEYGNLKGFPHIDYIHFCLQVVALLYKWKPLKAYNKLLRFIPDNIGVGFSQEEIESLIKITAFDSYIKSKHDGVNDEDDLQLWRTQLWRKE